MTTRETEIVDRETGRKRRLALIAWQVNDIGLFIGGITRRAI